MAFALLSRSSNKPQASVKPAPKQKFARTQHSADSRFGFAKPVLQPPTAALPATPVIQTKLKVGERNDKFEQEADQVAELTENGGGSILPAAAAQSRSPVGSLQRLYGNQAVLQMRHGFGGPPALSAPLRPSQGGILRRKCACGGAAGMSGGCEECSKKKRLGLQTKLKISEPGDIYEQEADRIADQVMAMPARPAVSDVPPRIQRFAGQPTGQMDAAPASVDQALASPGRPLEPALRQGMERRFGYDFSQVRVHFGAAAEQSAQDVNGHAYTVGHDVVFGAGRFVPGTHEGRRLIAHELAHTIQQSSHASTLDPGAATLQRSPDQPQEAKPSIRSPLGISRQTDPDPLLFAKGFHAGPIELTSPVSVAAERFVTESNIVEWAAQYIWNDVTLRGGSREKKRLVNLLQRGEDEELHALWRSHGNLTLMQVAPFGFADVPGVPDVPHPNVELSYSRDNPFSGSETARRRWAKYLFANWTQVNAKLDEKVVVDLLFQQIRDTLRSGAIPPGASLVTEPARIKQIEDEPEKGTLTLHAPTGIVMRVNHEWIRKRVRSVSFDYLYFEVIGHEGIYFGVSGSDLREAGTAHGLVATHVAKGTAGTEIVGQFIKGFLTALASPVMIVLDTGAKLLDMTTMAVSALAGKRWYTCLSSTCQQYDACLKSNKSADECRSDALGQALEEATIIIPLYRQGSECLGNGDPEACGAIAALSLGLVEGGVRRLSKREFGEAAVGAAKGGKLLTKAEFEEAAIREAIGRPRPGGPSFAKALEKPKVRKETAPPPPRLELTKPSRPTPRMAEDVATERVVHEAASQAGSEVKLGDGTHGVAAAGKGNRAGFHFCSNHCTLVADKLEQIEKVLPEKSDIQRDIRFLKNKVRGLDNEVKAGRLTKEQADRAAQDIAKGLRENAGTAVVDTLLQMSVEDIQANRASLKKQVSRALERGKEITKEIAADQDVTGVLEDPKARAKVTGKVSPGREPRQFLRGNFAHRFYEHIRHLTGVKLEAEVVVALRDGTGDIIRADRIIRHSDQGLLLEIKPKGLSAERGRAQLPGRLKALQREFPKKNGWVGRVMEYTRADVEAWLRAENVPDARIPEIMAELGF